MKAYPYIKQTRREFIRERRKAIKQARKALDILRRGCSCNNIFDGTGTFHCAVMRMKSALETMDQITKPLA